MNISDKDISKEADKLEHDCIKKKIKMSKPADNCELDKTILDTKNQIFIKWTISYLISPSIN